MSEEEEIIEEEVVEISDDSEGMILPNENLDGGSVDSVEISADTPQDDDRTVEELIVEEGEAGAVESEEVAFDEVTVEEEFADQEILVNSSNNMSIGSTTMNTASVPSFVEGEVEIESPSPIESLVQIDQTNVVAPVEELGDSWNPGRIRPKSPISPRSSHDEQYIQDDDHSWMMPQRKQPSKDTMDRVTPKTSHRKAEGIRLEDAINSIDGTPLSPALSKVTLDTTIKSSDSLDQPDSPHSESRSWTHPSDNQTRNADNQLPRGEKESSESDDSSLIRRQKQVQFAGLPEHPPELTKPTNPLLPVVQENRGNDSSSSYETDPSEASYETDSSASEDLARPLDTSSGRLVNVSYRPSTPFVNPLPSPPAIPASPVSSSTSDVESQPQHDYFSRQRQPDYFKRQPQPEHFSPAGETRPKESTLCRAHIICIALLLLVGTALCLYFFYDFTRDEHRDRLNFTKEPAISPTFAPVAPPTLPTRPSSPPIFPTKSPTLSTVSPTPSEPTPRPAPPAPSTSLPTGIQIQNNDECADAIGPLTPGTSIQGTTQNAREDEVDSCDNTSNNGLPGVWYYVLGNGGEMMAHTCKNTAIDSKISIYGGPCSNPQCLEVSDNFCGRQSAVSWDSEFQKPYYILVQGRSRQRAIGDFELSIEARYNDECNNAITLKASPDANAPTIMGQTLEAHPNPFVCNGVVNESPSLFYSVRGSGEELAVIFQDGTDFKPKISVLVGDCSGLSCVTQSEDRETQLSWPSIRNVNYYVLIHGETGSDVGNFAFQVQSADVVSQGRVPW